MFSEVVATILISTCPIKVQLVLCNAVLDPVIPHIEGLRAFHAYLRGKDIMCGGIVSFDRCACSWLEMSHFGESGNDRAGCLSAMEYTTSFGFGGRSGDAWKCFYHEV